MECVQVYKGQNVGGKLQCVLYMQVFFTYIIYGLMSAEFVLHFVFG